MAAAAANQSSSSTNTAGRSRKLKSENCEQVLWKESSSSNKITDQWQSSTAGAAAAAVNGKQHCLTWPLAPFPFLHLHFTTTTTCARTLMCHLHILQASVGPLASAATAALQNIMQIAGCLKQQQRCIIFNGSISDARRKTLVVVIISRIKSQERRREEEGNKETS